MTGLQSDLALVRRELNNNNSNNNNTYQYPVITFLGTGSSIPSKYRNVSCILVQIQVKQIGISNGTDRGSLFKSEMISASPTPFWK